MIELAQHIETLLLENDCVILPGLGGFVAHYTPAMQQAGESLFVPPVRSIGFNPQIQLNDGVLVQSYMNVYATSFADATRRVDEAVRRLTDTLHEEGVAHLPNVGELHCSIHGTYSFTPYNERLTTPRFYGWDSFEMQPLPLRQAARHPAAQPALHRPHTSERPWRMRIHRHASRVATAMAVIALALLSLLPAAPIENTEIAEENYARLLPGELFEKIECRALTATPVAVHTQQTASQKRQKSATSDRRQPVKPVVAREVKVSEVKTSEVAPTQPVAAPAVKEAPTKPMQNAASRPQKAWHIIVASVGTERDAQAMANRLVEQGHRGAHTVIGDGKMHVSIASYPSETEAYRALADIRKDEAYKQAWVLAK